MTNIVVTQAVDKTVQQIAEVYYYFEFECKNRCIWKTIPKSVLHLSSWKMQKLPMSTIEWFFPHSFSCFRSCFRKLPGKSKNAFPTRNSVHGQKEHTHIIWNQYIFRFARKIKVILHYTLYFTKYILLTSCPASLSAQCPKLWLPSKTIRDDRFVRNVKLPPEISRTCTVIQ